MAHGAEGGSTVAADASVTVYRLAKVVGWFAIMASAVSQEYGAGINFVLVNSLGQYPRITSLVPLAMFGAGILLVPKIALYVRFSQVIPRAGSTYVWMARSLGLPIGFVVAFLWFIGVLAGMGILAFTSATFVSTSLRALGLPGAHFAVTPAGHVIIGGLLIALILWLHYSGVGNYATFVIVMFFVVLTAALIAIGYGFGTSPDAFLRHVTSVLPAPGAPPANRTPALGAFVAVMTLFMFAYGGLTAATSLGGEARRATSTMPVGIFWGWLAALVLYTAVAAALFHAVPWWIVQPLVKSKHAELATTPGLIGLVAPRAVGALVNVLVAVIVAKTMAPVMLDCSRYLFAWAEDGLLPAGFLHTAPSKAPDVALFTCAGIGFLFLLQATFVGWAIGVTLRAMSLVLVFGIVGLGALNLRWNSAFRKVPWAQQIAGHADVPVFSVLAILVAIVLLSSVIVVPNTPFWFQPSVQAVIAILLAIWIYAAAAGRSRVRGVDLAAHARAVLPVE